MANVGYDMYAFANGPLAFSLFISTAHTPLNKEEAWDYIERYKDVEVVDMR